MKKIFFIPLALLLSCGSVKTNTAQISVSKWFAQFAEAEKQKPLQSWDGFFAALDNMGPTNPDATDGWDTLLKDRYSGLGTDAPRESF